MARQSRDFDHTQVGNSRALAREPRSGAGRPYAADIEQIAALDRVPADRWFILGDAGQSLDPADYLGHALSFPRGYLSALKGPIAGSGNSPLLRKRAEEESERLSLPFIS